MSTPPLAPGVPSFDTTVYIVLNDFGPLGSAYVETDEAEADENTIVSARGCLQYTRRLGA